jgi:hypothetical protein
VFTTGIGTVLTVGDVRRMFRRLAERMPRD